MRYNVKGKKVALCALIAILSWIDFAKEITFGADVKARPATTSFSQRESRLPTKLSLRVPAGFNGRQKVEGRVEKRSPADQSKIAEAYGRLPLIFEPNLGQTSEEVKFFSRIRGYNIFLTETDAVIVFRQFSQAKDVSVKAESPHVVRMKLVGAQPDRQISGLDKLPGKSNYFIGNDPKTWRTDISHYAKVKYEDVYPGIDLVYHSDRGKLEYDFIVAPGADPGSIKLAFEGAQKMEIDAEGQLRLFTSTGQLLFQKPAIYQEVGSVRKRIDGEYAVYGSGDSVSLTGSRNSNNKAAVLGFQVAEYDASKPLIIDPVLVYSTYLGGTANDQALGISVDSSGNAYVTGTTSSIDFPITPGALQPSCPSGMTSSCSSTVFVSKINSTGTDLLYSTYIGPGLAHGIAVDSSGSAYIVGETSSRNFPVTAGAFQVLPSSSAGNTNDGFITKLAAAGNALSYSTYLGGGASDRAMAVAVDSVGNAYITGITGSFDFPTTPGAFFVPVYNGSYVFVTKVNVSGTGLEYSTYLGSGASTGIAVDDGGHAYVTGNATWTNFPVTPEAVQPYFAPNPPSGINWSDVFISKLDPTGTSLLYSSYFGGTGADEAGGIAVDQLGNAYIVGSTSSTDFPVTTGAFQTTSRPGDAFVAKFDTNASGVASLIYATRLGGSGEEQGIGITVDSAGNAYVAGNTASWDFPLKNPIQFFAEPTTPQPFRYIAFVSELNQLGTDISFSTYLGGSDWDSVSGIALDTVGNVYIAGQARSIDFPTTAEALDPACSDFATRCFDAFVSKISPGANDGPEILVTPAYHDFGVVYVGAALNQVFTIWNTGSDILKGDLSVSPPLSVWQGASYSIAPAASQRIPVLFQPSCVGRFTRMLNFTGAAGATAILKAAVAARTNEVLLNITQTGVGTGTITVGQNVTSDASCSMPIPAGFQITLLATPAPGSTFYGWSGACRGRTPCTLTMKTSKKITAVFTKDLAMNEEVPAEGEVGAFYWGAVHPTGGTSPYSFAITSGALPDGIIVEGETIQGTPMTAGTNKFLLTVTDQNGAAVNVSHSIRVYPAVTISTSSLAAGAVGRKYKAGLKVAGGKKPYIWSWASWPAPGLSLNSRTGQITGTPTTAGTYNLTVQVSDALGAVTQKTLTLSVN